MGKAARIVIVAALAVGVVFYLKAQDQQDAGRPSGTPASEDKVAQAVSPEQSAALPRLLDLGADKCIPCKAMAPILDELRREYEGRLDVVFIDVWKDPEAGRRYGVRMIPTQIFFDASGKELWRHEGFMAKEDILAKWKELGVDLNARATTEPENQGTRDERN